MAYRELGYELLDHLRVAQLVANDFFDYEEGKAHIRTIANILPLHRMIGQNFNVQSSWALFQSSDLEPQEGGIKHKSVALVGEVRGINFVKNVERTVGPLAVTLSNVHILAGETIDQIDDEMCAADESYMVYAVHLPVLAIQSWAAA